MGRTRKTPKPETQQAGDAADARASDTSQEKHETTGIRVDPDLAKKLKIISSALGRSISDIISPLLRPIVEKLYAEVLKKDLPPIDPQYK